jgi:hypothetical protein
MIRVILARAGERPRVLDLDDAGPMDALRELLGGAVVRFDVEDGTEIWCSRSGLMFGLALVRRMIAMVRDPHARASIRLDVEEPHAGLGRYEWHANGDFVVARAALDGAPSSLTDHDIREWGFWLGVDYFLRQ